MDISSLITETVYQMGNPLLIPLIIGVGLQAIGTGIGIAQGSKQKKDARALQAQGSARLDASLKGMRETVDNRKSIYDNIFRQVYGRYTSGDNTFGNKGYNFDINQVDRSTFPSGDMSETIRNITPPRGRNTLNRG